MLASLSRSIDFRSPSSSFGMPQQRSLAEQRDADARCARAPRRGPRRAPGDCDCRSRSRTRRRGRAYRRPGFGSARRGRRGLCKPRARALASGISARGASASTPSVFSSSLRPSFEPLTAFTASATTGMPASVPTASVELRTLSRERRLAVFEAPSPSRAASSAGSRRSIRAAARTGTSSCSTCRRGSSARRLASRPSSARRAPRRSPSRRRRRTASGTSCRG